MNAIIANANEVFLLPGQIWFGGGEIRLRTILGSCVAITFWHPQRRIGGMCHYVLAKPRCGTEANDARYGSEAVAQLVLEMRAAGTDPDEYEAKLFGGGRMFPSLSGRTSEDALQRRNIDAARTLVAACGARIRGEHLGGDGHRHLVFDVSEGDVWLRHWPLLGTTRPKPVPALR
ncbi:MAG TPA: chemotaxis protein CheD [Arenimonas sp.]|nr:chemotaxis protein CheD [Arenimonas sp.]